MECYSIDSDMHLYLIYTNILCRLIFISKRVQWFLFQLTHLELSLKNICHFDISSISVMFETI